MAPDPLHPHHPASDLEASTAITSVTPDVMAHAAKHAADLVAGVANRLQATSSKSGRGGKKAAAAAQSLLQDPAPIEPATAPTEPDAAAQPAETESSVDRSVVASEAVEDGIAEQGPALARFTILSTQAVRTNIDALFEHWTSMMGAKSIPEALSLNADFLRKQVEAVTAQSRDLSALAQQLATESLTRFTRHSDKP